MSSGSPGSAVNGDVQVVIVGDGVDRQASSNQQCPQRFSPARCTATELAAAYASMDVFVHTGEHETFCQVVQEALASGLPVIAPDAGGPRDLVTPLRTGLLLGVNEFEAAAARCGRRTCWKNVTAIRRQPARSVLGRSWPAICDELLGHYEAVQSPIATGASPHVADGATRRASDASLALRQLGDRLPLLPRCVAGFS